MGYQADELQVHVYSRFFTPQPQRGAAAPRRSLVSIGGPAVRFQREEPEPKNMMGRIQPTPGKLGKPVRMATPARREVVPDDTLLEKEIKTETPTRSLISAESLAEVSY
jgi:hypothetical protein